MKTLIQTLFFFLLVTQICFGQWYQQNPELNIVTFSNLYDVALIDENNGWVVGDSGTVLRTTNDGIDWIEQQSNVTNKLNAVCFVDANDGWAVADSGIIIRTTNGGVSWLQQSSGVSQNLNDVSFCDNSRGLVVGNNGKILRTTDGGNNWISQTLGNYYTFSGVHFINANIGWIVGDGIIKTTDGGQSWIFQVPVLGDFWTDVHFIDENIGWIAGHSFNWDGLVLKTTDGGYNWISHIIANGLDLRGIHFEDLNDGWMVGNDKIFKTTNGGIQWTSQSFADCAFHSISFHNNSVGIVVGEVGTILNSTNGGNDWSILFNAFTYPLNGVAFKDVNNGIIVGYSGRMMITSDGGSLWSKHTSGTDKTLNDIQFVDESYGWAVGDNGTIIKTTNGGISWFQQMGDSTFSLTAVHFINENIGWVVGGNSIILKTTNGGISWINQLAPTEYYPLKDVHFTDASTGFIATGYEWFIGCDGSILKTTNGGDSWYEQIIQEETFWHSISFSDNQNGIVVGTKNYASKIYIFRTTNGGTSWVLAFEIEGYSLFFTSTASPDSNYFWVSGLDFSSGNALLFSSDNGLTWVSQIDPGLYFNSLHDICFINFNTGWAVGDNGLILHTTNGGVPVELTSFTALANGKEVILNWSTATETNNQRFEIERQVGSMQSAIGNNNWEKVGFVPGFGTTTEPKSYSFTDSEVLAGKYSYRLKQIDFDGSYEYSTVVEVEVSVPIEFALEQNYPNPFNPSTKIKYSIPQISQVQIKVFDVLGKEVETLVNEEKRVGTYELTWNAANLPSGVYFYSFQTGSFIDTKKMILLK